ncbi:MAG: DUF402 domain-containing protein [Candidatus Saccharimonadaceae bacterium]
MKLHLPKHISSTEGLGIGTTKTMRRIDEHVSIGTEVWNEMSQPWAEGPTVIAKPGYIWTSKWELNKPYIITKFQDADRKLVAVYCDVSRPVQAIGDGFSFIDLYLDVFQLPGQEPTILDKDELKAAVEATYITPDEAEEARRIADELVASLKNDPEFLQF